MTKEKLNKIDKLMLWDIIYGAGGTLLDYFFCL